MLDVTSLYFAFQQLL